MVEENHSEPNGFEFAHHYPAIPFYILISCHSLCRVMNMLLVFLNFQQRRYVSLLLNREIVQNFFVGPLSKM